MVDQDLHPGEAPRWPKRAAIGLLSIALLWLVLVRGYADYLAGPDPQRAAKLNPTHPVAITQLASQALEAGEISQAMQLAERIAVSFPFEGRALRVLGAAAERQGDGEQAARLMNAAALAAPRDTATQYWLALRALSEEDLDQALLRMDRVLRFQPETLAELFPLLGTIAANPFGARKLVPFLSPDRYWAGLFLTRFTREATPVSAVLDLERLLAAAGTPMGPEQTGNLTSRLYQAGQWELLAARIQQRSGKSSQTIRDPNFSGVPAESLLGWGIGRFKGADVILGAQDDSGTAGVQVLFHDRRIDFKDLSQLLILPTGRHAITGQVRLHRLETPRGLQWTLRCVGGRGEPLGQSELFLGTTPWREFAFTLEVPETDCPAQRLTLEVAARIAAERQLEGSVWFSGMGVEALSDEGTSDERGQPE